MSAERELARIFVSHSHLDDEFGLRLVRDLRLALKDERAVWYDSSEGLRAGDPFFTKIAQEILDRPIFLVIVSPASMASKAVQDEISLAWNQRISPSGKLIIPVLYQEAPLVGFLQVLQYVSFSPPRTYTTAFEELCNAIGISSYPDSARAATAIASSSSYEVTLVRDVAPKLEAAFQSADWDDVIHKGELLERDAPSAVPFATYSLLGRAYLRKGQPQDAHRVLTLALTLNQLDVATLRAAAQACRQLGLDAEAEPLLERALAIVGERTERLALLGEYAEALTAPGQWAAVLDCAVEALTLAPGDHTWLGVQVQALAQQHRFSEALPLALNLTGRPDANAEDWQLRARVEAGLSQKQAARASLAQAQRLAPGSPQVAATYLELFPVADERFPESLARQGFTPRNLHGVEVIVPPLAPILAGVFVMGSEATEESAARANEQPEHRVTLDDYSIGRFPVTVAEYACFVRAGGREPPTQRTGLSWTDQLQRLDHPIVCVTWYDAVTYAAWLASVTGQPWRLPTEAEWEKAARWDAGANHARLFPWGNVFDVRCCNTLGSDLGATTPIGAYPNGASAYSVQDMVGNVWEWTSTLARPYPYRFDDGRDELESSARRILRGGSWGNDPFCARPAYRDELDPRLYDDLTGFRLACGSAPRTEQTE